MRTNGASDRGFGGSGRLLYVMGSCMPNLGSRSFELAEIWPRTSVTSTPLPNSFMISFVKGAQKGEKFENLLSSGNALGADRGWGDKGDLGRVVRCPSGY